jgi:hypothetical protein
MLLSNGYQVNFRGHNNWDLDEIVNGEAKTVISIDEANFSQGIGALNFLSMAEKTEIRKEFWAKSQHMNNLLSQAKKYQTTTTEENK